MFVLMMMLLLLITTYYYGSVYIDVEELFKWHLAKCESHPCFKRLDDDVVIDNDPAVKAMLECTEESKKIDRLGGRKYFAVYERLPLWKSSNCITADGYCGIEEGDNNDSENNGSMKRKYNHIGNDENDDSSRDITSNKLLKFDSMIMNLFH